MGNIADRIAKLPPEKRDVILRQLEALKSPTASSQAEQGPVIGIVPLLPAQKQLLTMMTKYHLNYHNFNISTLLEIDFIIETPLAQQVVQYLLTYHDALRMRLRLQETEWQQFIAEPDTAAPFQAFDFSSLSPDKQKIAIEETGAQFQESLNLSEGPILRIIYFKLGQDVPGRLLFIVHHFASDAVSQKILIEDFMTAYQQLSHQQPIRLLPKTTSVKQRAERFLSYSSSPQLHNELGYWLHLPWSEVTPLPVDYPEKLRQRPQAQKIERTLSREETQELLNLHLKSEGKQSYLRLLTALVEVFTTWMDAHALVLSMHHHGRQPLFEDLDFSRTIGWLACNPRILFTVPQPPVSTRQLLQSITEQLNQVPNEGIGYEFLRHLSTDEATIQALTALPGPSLAFDYLGQHTTPLALRPASEGTGDNSPLSHQWKNDFHMITAEIVDEQLWIRWEYSETVYRQETIQALFDHVLSVLRTMNS